MMMIAMTIINSNKVKPAKYRQSGAAERLTRSAFRPILRAIVRTFAFSPLHISRSIERRGLGFGIHIKHILAAPHCRIRLVLHGSEPPVCLTRHGIDRNAPQETSFFVSGADDYAIHEGVEIRGITLAAQFGADQVPVARVLVAVDRVAHFAEGAAQFSFFPV